MRRTILMALVAILGCTTMQATEKNDNATEANTVSERKVGDFTKIEFTGSFDVVYTQGNKTGVKVVGNTDYVKRINTIVEKGVLKIWASTQRNSGFNFFNSFADVKVYVTSPDLIGLTIKGSGNFESKSKIDSDNLAINVIGSGDVDLADIICDNLKLKLQGSGDVEINSLRCATSSIDLQGSGDIKIIEYQVKNTNIGVYGSGDVALTAKKCGTINAIVCGSGDITLSGSAQHLNKTIRGSGDISSSRLSTK